MEGHTRLWKRSNAAICSSGRFALRVSQGMTGLHKRGLQCSEEAVWGQAGYFLIVQYYKFIFDKIGSSMSDCQTNARSLPHDVRPSLSDAPATSPVVAAERPLPTEIYISVVSVVLSTIQWSQSLFNVLACQHYQNLIVAF